MTAITSTWTDLYDRLDHAATTLAELSRDENRTESDRDHLRSKAQGVRLALSYMQDMGGSENGRDANSLRSVETPDDSGSREDS